MKTVQRARNPFQTNKPTSNSAWEITVKRQWRLHWQPSKSSPYPLHGIYRTSKFVDADYYNNSLNNFVFEFCIKIAQCQQIHGDVHNIIICWNFLSIYSSTVLNERVPLFYRITVKETATGWLCSVDSSLNLFFHNSVELSFSIAFLLIRP